MFNAIKDVFPLPDSGQDSEGLCITHTHTGQLGVCVSGWVFLCLSDRHKYEGKKIENIG